MRIIRTHKIFSTMIPEKQCEWLFSKPENKEGNEHKGHSITITLSWDFN